VIGKFVDAQFDRLLNIVESVARWLLEKPKPRNVWPDDLHGAGLRRSHVQAAQRSGLSASDNAAPADAPSVKPVGSVVRDTPVSAAGEVAGEDAPQNQPHQCVCVGCGCDEFLPVDARLFAVNPVYEQLQNEFHENQK
jgi:hypothetical protein